MRITPDSLGRLHDFMAEHQVKTVLARRCFPELSGAVDLSDLARTFEMAGVQVIMLEGRVAGATTKHALGRVQAEVSALAPTYALKASSNNVRVLVHPHLLDRSTKINK